MKIENSITIKPKKRLNNCKEKQVVQGKRTKIDKTVHSTLRRFLVKFNTAIRSLSNAKD